MGLFAAIPAVLAYNRLAARGDALLNRYETFLDEFSGILQRQTYALKAHQAQKVCAGAGCLLKSMWCPTSM